MPLEPAHMSAARKVYPVWHSEEHCQQCPPDAGVWRPLERLRQEAKSCLAEQVPKEMAQAACNEVEHEAAAAYALYQTRDL
mmetsp:Transcript_2967/g.7575  ORF Transcript_2967/g.7575 Transcript_2967/m.7575 type:complete len:81 (-) Transcript_2967:1043-1285(-)